MLSRLPSSSRTSSAISSYLPCLYSSSHFSSKNSPAESVPPQIPSKITSKLFSSKCLASGTIHEWWSAMKCAISFFSISCSRETAGWWKRTWFVPVAVVTSLAIIASWSGFGACAKVVSAECTSIFALSKANKIWRESRPPDNGTPIFSKPTSRYFSTAFWNKSANFIRASSTVRSVRSFPSFATLSCSIDKPFLSKVRVIPAGSALIPLNGLISPIYISMRKNTDIAAGSNSLTLAILTSSSGPFEIAKTSSSS